MQKTAIDRLTLQAFWQAGRKYRRDFIMSWLSPLTSLGLGIAIPYCVGKILASLAQPSADVSVYVQLLIGFCVATVLINKITFTSFLAWQPKVMADLQAASLHHLLRRGLGFHNNHVAGKLVSDSLDYPSAFSQLSTVFFIDILPFLLIILTGIILVSLDSLLIGMVLLSMTLIVIAATVRFRQRMAPFRRQRQVATKSVTSHLADVIVNTATVKSFGREIHEQDKHNELGATLLASRLHDWREVANDGNYRIAGLLVFEIIFILIVVQQVAANPNLLATGIFAFSYTVTLTNRLFQIGSMMRTVEESLLLAAPMTETLQNELEIRDAPNATNLHIVDGHIDFNDVGFRYPDSRGDQSIFTNLELHVKAGEKIGLVGPSGSGKSTLTKLLLRFEDVTDGSITIDGYNISQVSQTSLHQAIGYVPQEPLLFHRTIGENIIYGKLDASDEEVTTAAKKAYALDFIRQLPHGFDTIVGERGVKLSGGQRQRVAIARAILKDAPILLLDEATSALDSESEQVIQNALQELMQNRTTIVIAHRLSTIQKMDRIIVMDDGAIIEQGSHQQLISAGGTYARLWSHQSGGFIES